jgi:hypothetical protein
VAAWIPSRDSVDAMARFHAGERSTSYVGALRVCSLCSADGLDSSDRCPRVEYAEVTAVGYDGIYVDDLMSSFYGSWLTYITYITAPPGNFSRCQHMHHAGAGTHQIIYKPYQCCTARGGAAPVPICVCCVLTRCSLGCCHARASSQRL